MPPLTRSSAPSTPAKPRVSTDGLPTPPSTEGSTRRTPHCTKCHRPRAGHPRSGCPYVDASESTPPSPSGTREAAQLTSAGVDDVMSEELSSLHIVSPTTEAENRRASDVLRHGQKPQRRLSVRFALVPEQTLGAPLVRRTRNW
ncbi:hypothetical protein JVU11DRAFT_1928 [Chiua virens]|nr:hypothetical protein JVU11DRAFT_1928 [Chiua virens]